MQDVDMISRNWEDGECLGVMAGTFGGSIRPVQKVVDRNNVPAVRWHLSFCNHGDQCQPGECKSNDLPCMQKKARDISAFHRARPNTQCFISPRCEYQERNANKVNSWFKAVGAVAPNCELVASAMPGSYLPPGIMTEKHGNEPGQADIVSNDGANYFDSDSVKYNQLGRRINLKWTNRYNLRLTSEKTPPPPPRKRSKANRVGQQDFQQMQLMKEALPPMPNPPFCRSIRSLRNGEIWKNHAEDYGANNDSRGNKPLLMSLKKANRWDIFNASGKRIACVKLYPGMYQNKLHRLYVGSCSGDHAVDLFKDAGQWIFVKDGSTCIALPSIRRWGSYRAIMESLSEAEEAALVSFTSK